MLTHEELSAIRNSIRENWNKPIDWNRKLPNKHTYNCLMYVLGCTVSTEHFNMKTYRVEADTTDGTPYFAYIGNFSQKHTYRTFLGLLDAFMFDMHILGIEARVCSLEEELPPTSRKIGFWYDSTIQYGGNFHFIMQDEGDTWSHKAGWPGEIEHFSISSFEDPLLLTFISFFELRLRQDCS